MRAATKLGVYGVVLAAALGGGAAVGAIAGPISIGSSDHPAEHRREHRHTADRDEVPAHPHASPDTGSAGDRGR